VSKDKRVNRYRSGSKNPEQEVHVFRDEEGQVKVHIVDYEAGKIITLKKEGEVAK
jgi:hypothetical protein